MKYLLSFLVLIGTAGSLIGCAISPTYGEKDLRDFEDDYGLSLPIAPKYKLVELGKDLYSITLHQGSALISPGHVRAEYLHQAARVIATDTCQKAGKDLGQTNVKRSGEAGWVHLQGTFHCIRAGSVPKPTQLLGDTKEQLDDSTADLANQLSAGIKEHQIRSIAVLPLYDASHEVNRPLGN